VRWQVLNALLRSLLQSKLIEQAANLVARTNFPEGASNNQLCRYLYYVGRIQAVQLDYSEAFAKLNQVGWSAGRSHATTHLNRPTLVVLVLLLPHHACRPRARPRRARAWGSGAACRSCW
jgi:26S proteasome regulatory subunit N3